MVGTTCRIRDHIDLFIKMNAYELYFFVVNTFSITMKKRLESIRASKLPRMIDILSSSNFIHLLTGLYNWLIA